MAARKSCTHLTWAEAKANSKVGGSSSKKPLLPKKIDHGKALTAKVVAKNGPSREEVSKERALRRRAQRGEERAAAAAQKRAEEKERQRKERRVKPFHLAQERMIALADKLQDAPDVREEGGGGGDGGAGHIAAECRALQVDEVLGLEALYNPDGDGAGNRELRIARSSEFAALQELVERWQTNPDDEDTARQIESHPPLSLTIQLIVDGAAPDEEASDGSGGDAEQLAAVLLLRATLPPRYPLHASSSPDFRIEYFVCTHRDMDCPPDKPLASLAHLDEARLKDMLAEEARHMAPDPCVYHVVEACLKERLFECVKMSVQGRHALEQYRSETRGDRE